LNHVHSFYKNKIDGWSKFLVFLHVTIWIWLEMESWARMPHLRKAK
jgi:hypothetical protein